MTSIFPTEHRVYYRRIRVDGINVFYRDTGDSKAPALLLLHGFPSSSHMFRDLIPLLSDRFHIVAPDLPGFGFSEAPDRAQFNYTFEHLTQVIDSFTESVGLRCYALYVFDYGAPVGFRLALAHPERVTAIISQNGNAYEEGLSQGWNPIQKYWKEPTETNRAALRDFLKPETTRFSMFMASRTRRWSRRSPMCSTRHCSGGPAMTSCSSTCSSITLPMSGSIQSSRNIHAPSSRRSWRSGARTIRSSCRPEPRRSNGTTRKAEVHFYDTGHFALETHVHEIAGAIGEFLGRYV